MAGVASAANGSGDYKITTIKANLGELGAIVLRITCSSGEEMIRGEVYDTVSCERGSGLALACHCVQFTFVELASFLIPPPSRHSLSQHPRVIPYSCHPLIPPPTTTR